MSAKRDSGGSCQAIAAGRFNIGNIANIYKATGSLATVSVETGKPLTQGESYAFRRRTDSSSTRRSPVGMLGSRHRPRPGGLDTTPMRRRI
jgi:hypothetical protein